MSVLLIAEHNNKEVKPFTFNAITAASQIDQDLHVLVIGNKADEVSKSISQVPNVKKVIHIDNEIYENYLPENFTLVIIKQAENISNIVYNISNIVYKKYKLLVLCQFHCTLLVLAAKTRREYGWHERSSRTAYDCHRSDAGARYISGFR